MSSPIIFSCIVSFPWISNMFTLKSWEPEWGTIFLVPCQPQNSPLFLQHLIQGRAGISWVSKQTAAEPTEVWTLTTSSFLQWCSDTRTCVATNDNKEFKWASSPGSGNTQSHCRAYCWHLPARTGATLRYRRYQLSQTWGEEWNFEAWKEVWKATKCLSFKKSKCADSDPLSGSDQKPIHLLLQNWLFSSIIGRMKWHFLLWDSAQNGNLQSHP